MFIVDVVLISVPKSNYDIVINPLYAGINLLFL